jgi:hypothetical protein
VTICRECFAENTAAFWSFMDGTITYAGFIRRLRRKS